jgi:hypothetical protein
MYMGFMKQGISMMAIFILCFVVPSVLSMSDVFILFAVLVWFYSFFHARNLAASSEEEFKALPDDYVWASLFEENAIKITNPTLRRWGAIVLIVYGASKLWDVVERWLYYLVPDRMWQEIHGIINEVPEVAIAVVIIVVGLKLIAGKKEELDGEGKQ